VPDTMTSDVIVDRVRSVCAGAPFYFTEAIAWDSFDLQPTTNVEACFRIPPPTSQSVVGGIGFYEDRTDAMQVWVARKIGGDYQAVRRTLLRDLHSLTAAIVRDAAEASGDYHIPDGGRGHAITPVTANAEYVALRLTLPINYESAL
jgi:hypothetical protein